MHQRMDEWFFDCQQTNERESCFSLMEGSQKSHRTSEVTLFDSSAHCFKNGLTLFSKLLVLPAESSSFSFVPAPKAVHGTLMCDSLEPNPIVIRLDSEEVRESCVPESATTTSELLFANNGRVVSVLSKSTGTWTSGIVSGMHQDILIGDQEKMCVLLTNHTETVSIRLVDVVQVKGDNLVTQMVREYVTNGIKLVYEPQLSSTQVRLSWLAKGLAWTPTYCASLAVAERKLVISGSAIIFSDFSTERHFSKLTLSSGAPSVTNSGLLHPLVFKGSSEEFFSQAENGYREVGGFGRRVSTRASSPCGEDVAVSSSSSSEIGDFIWHEFKDIHICAGGRIVAPIFSVECDYSETYSIQASSDSDDLVSNKLLLADHQVHFKNTSKFPLTSGPIAIQKASCFVCQSSISKIVPVNTLVKLALAAATDVQIVQDEVSTRTEDVVRVSGSLFLRSYKGFTIEVTLKMTISGDLVESSIPFLTRKQITESEEGDGDSVVKWKISLEPGVQRVLSYVRQYHYEEKVRKKFRYLERFCK